MAALRPFGLAGAVVIAACELGCATPARSTVLSGRELLPDAAKAMASEGLVFAPYEAPTWLGAEETQAHYRCIGAVNRTVYDVLARRFQVAPPPPTPPGASAPRWIRAPGGPRVAVHVGSLRCGKTNAEDGFTLTPLTTAQEGERPPVEIEDLPAGEVVLEIVDRRSGLVVIKVQGVADGDSVEEAAKQAAEAAARELVGP
jgi:hypothetical protein